MLIELREDTPDAARRPRSYAGDIIQLRTRVERKAALGRVPAHLQALVRRHVEIHFQRIKK